MASVSKGDPVGWLTWWWGMARADALDLLGETPQTLELVDRHI